jgi:flagellar protein FliJ
MADARQLARVHRVRQLQLTIARAAEAEANAALTSERELHARIDALAAQPGPAGGTAAQLGASAHYRDRLHQSLGLAHSRVLQAANRADQAAAATRSARQDEAAVDKLRARARLDALAREMRALEDLPQRPKRHGTC